MDELKIKGKIFAIKIGIIVGTALLAIALIMALAGAGTGEESNSEQGFESASTESWEQFIRYLHDCEGGGTIYKNSEGIDCYKVSADGGGGSAVGYGVDIGTHGSKLRKLRILY